MTKTNTTKSINTQDVEGSVVRTVKKITAKEVEVKKPLSPEERLQLVALQYHEANQLLKDAEDTVKRLKDTYLAMDPPKDLEFVDSVGNLQTLKVVIAEYISLNNEVGTGVDDKEKPVLTREDLITLLGEDYNSLIADNPKIKDKKEFIGYCNGKGYKDLFKLSPSISLRVYSKKT